MHILSSLSVRRATLGLALAGAFTLASAADFTGRVVVDDPHGV